MPTRISGKVLLGLLNFSNAKAAGHFTQGIAVRPDSLSASDGFIGCTVGAGLGGTEKLRFDHKKVKDAASFLRRAYRLDMTGDPLSDDGEPETVSEDTPGELLDVFTFAVPESRNGNGVMDFPKLYDQTVDELVPLADLTVSIEALKRAVNGLVEMVTVSDAPGSGVVRITIYEETKKVGSPSSPLSLETRLTDDGPDVRALVMNYQTRAEHPLHERVTPRTAKGY